MRARILLRHSLTPLNLLIRRRKISRYLAQTSEPKLQVGCGRNILPGWLNTDRGTILNTRGVVYLDARKRLPFADRTFYLVFNEHFIFRLTLEEAMRFLRECYRVLKPAGILRTATPLWSFLVELSRNQETAYQDYVRWVTRDLVHTNPLAPCWVINNFLYGIEHKSVLDRETLVWMHSEAGFTNITERAVGQSPHPGLQGIEGHGKFVPPQINQLETTVLEATKA
ncbi:MAG: methyltransferase domain-containing protein [Acidobacteria bacterium]|nr:methyltransferase domain-containing protein [Acidobacteriota bacterium]